MLHLQDLDDTRTGIPVVREGVYIRMRAPLLSILFCILLAGSLGFAEPFTERLYYDGYVATVGEGQDEAASIGTLVIRVYHRNSEVAALVDERDGSITNVWLHGSGDGEAFSLIVTTRSAGSGSYGTLAVYDFDRDRLATRNLPLPDPEQLNGYMGHDRYWFQNGQVFRFFPRYRSGDSNSNPTGGTALFLYLVDENSWMYAGEGTSIECLLPER